MLIYFSLLVCLVGLIIYLATKNNAKVEEVGRLMFACGMLAFLFGFSLNAVHLFNK